MKKFAALCLAFSACSTYTPGSTAGPADQATAATITPEDVIWTQLVHAAAAGGVLTKSGGQTGLDDSGAASTQQLASGDGLI
jgi:hypothetical protein